MIQKKVTKTESIFWKWVSQNQVVANLGSKNWDKSTVPFLNNTYQYACRNSVIRFEIGRCLWGNKLVCDLLNFVTEKRAQAIKPWELRMDTLAV